MTTADRAADSILLASRALLGVVARSLADALDHVTLPQFRVLIMVTAQGPTRMRDLAEQFGARPSTFTRIVDRLENGGWVERSHGHEDRREVLVTGTPAARQLVDEVTERRRREIAAILSRLDTGQHQQLHDAFDLFASAAQEPAAEELLILGL